MAMRSMSNREMIISFIGAFIAMLLASFFSNNILRVDSMTMVLASTGASAVLIFGLPHSPASRPWPVVGGHVVSAFVGVSVHYLTANLIVAAALATGLSMLAMHFARCMHPPGGATAVTAVVGGAAIYELGYYFIIVPVFFNAIILLSVAMAVATFREKNPFIDDE